MTRLLILASLLPLLLAACGGTTSSDPASMIVQYLEARVASDEAGLRALTCAAEEANIPIHANSFQGRAGKLNNVACTFDNASKVSCTGTIAVTYDGEVREIPPGNFTVVQEDGVWKWCGEAE